MKKYGFIIIAVFWLLLSQPGCDSGAGVGECEPGSTQSCLCQGEMLGVGLQTCDEDGKWTGCECGGGELDAAAAGDTDTDVDSEPVAVINADPTTGTAPLDVTFLSAIVGGNEPFTFAWDFGDGNTDTTEAPSHSYSAPGTYTAILAVTDADGDRAVDDIDIHVGGDDEPAVEILANPGSGVEPLTVTFGADIVGGNEPFSFEWDFDDDGSADATTQTATNVFNEGTHIVSLTITDADGDTASDSVGIEVTDSPEKPEAVATASSDCVVTDQNYVQLDGSGSSDPNSDELTYNWVFVTHPPYADYEFNDPTIQNPAFWPEDDGTYQIQLFVSDGTHMVGSEILTIVASRQIGAIETVEGNGQTSSAYNDFDEWFIIRVLNECGTPLPDAYVSLTGKNAFVPGGTTCGWGNFCNGTDDEGLLEFRGIAGYAAGDPASITAKAGCISATFDNLTVLPGRAQALVLEPIDDVGVADGEDELALNFQLVDGWLNPVTGPDVQFGLNLSFFPLGPPPLKDYDPDPLNNAWFVDAGANAAGECDGRDCWNLETENGQRTIYMSSTSVYPVYFFILNPRVIEDTPEGPSIGNYLMGAAKVVYQTGFEETNDENLYYEYNYGVSQWEIGSPTGSVGPDSAHTGNNVAGTNLSGNYDVIPQYFLDMYYGDGPRPRPNTRKGTKDAFDFMYPDTLLFSFEYFEYMYMPFAFLEFWHWYDMVGTGNPCPWCSPAVGNVSQYYYSDLYVPHTYYDQLYPVGYYPGPFLCYEYSYEYYDYMYSMFDKGTETTASKGFYPEMYDGFGGKGNGWEKVNMTMFPLMYDFNFAVVDKNAKEYNPPYYAEMYGPVWNDNEIMFNFWTSTYGIGSGPGWYLDDVKITAVSYIAATQFVNSGEPAYTETWQQSPYDYNGAVAGADADPCSDEVEPAMVRTIVRDEFDNQIWKSGIEIDFSFSSGGKDHTTASVDYVDRGTLVSSSGGITTVATDDKGVVRLAIKDTEAGSFGVVSELDGVADSDDYESVIFNSESFPTGDCCANPLIMNSGNPGEYMNMSTIGNLSGYHGFEGQCTPWEEYPPADAVFKFTVSETGLYRIYDNYNYRKDLRMGASCPGTQLPEQEINYNCYTSTIYAYLYEGTTYWVIIQSNGPNSGGTVTLYVQRDESGAL